MKHEPWRPSNGLINPYEPNDYAKDGHQGSWRDLASISVVIVDNFIFSMIVKRCK